MIIKTAGIVLHSIKYGETSLVVRIFTRQHGVQSYLVQGVRKAKARMHHNLFQPLTMVDLVVYHKEQSGLHRIKEIQCPEPYRSIPVDILKTTIVLFLAEVLTNTLKESDASPPMFDFVEQALRFLDRAAGKVSDFHLVFMLQLSRFLGFSPRNNYDERHRFFNLEEGFFQNTFHDPHKCLDQELSLHLHTLINTAHEEIETLAIHGPQRRILLNRIIDYYRYHLEGLREMHSHLILENVLH